MTAPEADRAEQDALVDPPEVTIAGDAEAPRADVPEADVPVEDDDPDL